jgi:hypothetical protein
MEDDDEDFGVELGEDSPLSGAEEEYKPRVKAGGKKVRA